MISKCVGDIVLLVKPRPADRLLRVDFDIGEELSLLVEMTERFAREKLSDGVRLHEAQAKLPAEIHTDFEDLSLHLLGLPPSISGFDFGPMAPVLVNEILGAVDPGAALALDRFSLPLHAVCIFGGTNAAAPIVTEFCERTEARAEFVVVGDDIELSSKTINAVIPWVPAHRADILVLVNRIGGCVIADDFTFEPVRGSGLRAAGASKLILENAIAEEYWADEVGAAKAVGAARLYTSSLMVGAMKHGCDFSREYAMEREAFGKKVAHHQAVAFKIVDMQIALESARELVRNAALNDAADLSAMAFCECVEAASLIGPDCVQLLGGHGFMQDFPVEKIFRELRSLGLMIGGVDQSKEDAFEHMCLGSELGGAASWS